MDAGQRTEQIIREQIDEAERLEIATAAAEQIRRAVERMREMIRAYGRRVIH